MLSDPLEGQLLAVSEWLLLLEVSELLLEKLVVSEWQLLRKGLLSPSKLMG